MNPRRMVIWGAISFLILCISVVFGSVSGAVRLIGIIASVVLGMSIGALLEWIHEEKRMDTWEFNYHKMESYYRLFMQWLSLKQEGKNLKEYLDFNGYHSVAIYGMSEPGERLLEELEDTDIEIRYVVDRNADNISTRFPKYKPDDSLPDVDVMIVTAVLSFQAVQEKIGDKVSFPIVSLEDLIYGLA